MESRDLFGAHGDDQRARSAPLAARVRPRQLNDLVGQEEAVGRESLLRRAIEADRLPSVILWGPPGSGKTTLAKIVAATTKAHFSPLSAVTAGVADIRAVVKEARERLGMYGQRTVLFVDEIHRFNKGQQDALLPDVEDGTITLMGATTENPSFEVNAPLLSRARVVQLHALDEAAIALILQRALDDEEHGLGQEHLTIDDDALAFLANYANGDARWALNALEWAALAVPRAGRITLETARKTAQRRASQFDRAGDAHFDAISALHKTIRGSDPDAALYWLARMLENGDDPLYIVRRLIRFAAEDIGLADPTALTLAVATQQAVHFIGMPEGAVILAELVVYLALAPKSNAAYVAYNAALADVAATRNEPVPLHLRNAPTALMREMGIGDGYKYAHDYDEALIGQVNLPSNLAGRRYYAPSDRGMEGELARRLARIRFVQERSMGEPTS